MHLKISSAKWRPFCPGNWYELISKSSSSGWVQKRLCTLAKHRGAVPVYPISRHIVGGVGEIALQWRHNEYDLASQITSLTIVYSTVYLGVDKRKHQSSASLVFVREIHRGPVNSPHKGPVTRKMFPFDHGVWEPYRYGYSHPFVHFQDDQKNLDTSHLDI